MPNDFQPRFAERLRAARLAQGWTQADFAEAIGLAPEAYGRLERARSVPRLETLISIARVLETSTDALLGLPGRHTSELREPPDPEPYEADPPEFGRLIRRLRRLPPRTVSAIARLVGAILVEPPEDG